MSERGGFTLIELILVTVIIGILAGSMVLAFQGRGEEARINRAKQDVVVLQNAIDLYAIDNNDKYPPNLNALKGGKRDYVRKLENDPWGNPYRYEVKNKGYTVYSMGSDGIAGNEDDVTSE